MSDPPTRNQDDFAERLGRLKESRREKSAHALGDTDAVGEAFAEAFSEDSSSAVFDSYEEYHAGEAGPSPKSISLSKDISLSRLINSYESRIQAAKRAIEEQHAEGLLRRAWADRELASALLRSDGLGLQILWTLESSFQLTASAVTGAVGASFDSVAPVLARLVQFDAVEEEDGIFSITDRGADVVRNLEIALGSSP